MFGYTEPLITPAITICFRKYDWQMIYIFGVQFNFSHLIDIVLIVAIIRRFMGSGNT